MKKANTTVIGVSVDTLESHRRFAKEFKLPFPLLSDADHAIAKAYGVPILAGGFHERVTFIIDEQGNIAKVFDHVVLQHKDGTTHIDDVLDTCRATEEG